MTRRRLTGSWLLGLGIAGALILGGVYGLPWMEGWFGDGTSRLPSHADRIAEAVGKDFEDTTPEADNKTAQDDRSREDADWLDAESALLADEYGAGEGAATASGGGQADGEDTRKEEGADEEADDEADEEEEESASVETEEGQLFNPNVSGRLEEVSERRIRGWVRDTNEPEATLHVQIVINEEEAYDVHASTRQEHGTLGVIWRFEISEPEELKEREQHVVRAFVYRRDQHGRTELAASPRTRDVGSLPRGRLEAASPEQGISGYAWEPGAGNKPAKVIIRINGEIAAELTADVKNEELRKRRITPRDNCAFRMDWPAQLDDGQAHTLQAFVVGSESGTEHELEGSPRAIGDRAGVANEPPVGRLLFVNKVVIAGWSWDPDAGGGSNDVEIWINNELHATVAANSRNDNLRNSGQTPTANHGFVLTTPSVLLDGRTHTIRAYGCNYPHGPKVELQGSPRQYRMEENSDPMGGFWRADENMLRGWAADPDLGSDPCEIEIYINGKLWQRTKADRHEEWMIGTGYAPDPAHGFAIRPPDFVKDGEKHEVTIYAINYPSGPPRHLGTRTIGVNSVFPGFWTGDRLLDSRIERGLQVTSVSPWFDAFDKGVKAGDVLLEYAGIEAGHAEKKDSSGNVTQPGSMTADFRVWLNSNTKRNDMVRFTFWRDGATYNAEIRMGQLSGQ